MSADDPAEIELTTLLMGTADAGETHRILSAFKAEYRAEVLHEAAQIVRNVRNAGVLIATSVDQLLDEEADKVGEKATAPAATATPEYAEPRYERYTTALRDADPYALIERRDDLRRFAKAAMQAADKELDPVYRDAYGTGREHAGAAGWLLNHFEAVISTSNGSHGVAEEYRCKTCGAIGAQVEGSKTLLDLVAMATRHECLPHLDNTTTTGEGGA